MEVTVTPTLEAHVANDSIQIDEDADIKLLAVKNRRKAMDTVVRRYRDRILHHALYVLKDYQEAVDVTQEVFIKAMREPGMFDEEFRIKAWIFRTTSNLCFTIVRDRRLRSNVLDAVLNAAAMTANADLREPTKIEHLLGGVSDAMDELTAEHGEIISLRYCSDLSYNEIADVLGIKLGTAMSRLSRAKTNLIKKMAERGLLVEV